MEQPTAEQGKYHYYPGLYCDHHGVEPVIIQAEGRWFVVTIRGVRFEGGVNGLTPELPAGRPELSTFRFRDVTHLYPSDEGTDGFREEVVPELVAYTLEWDMPVQVVSGGEVVDGRFTVRQRYLDPEDPERQWDDFTIILEYSGRRYMIRTVCFEALTLLQAKLPAGDYIKACFNCAYSDYSVYGNGPWGPMYCFRALKREYLELYTDFSKEGYFPKGAYMDLCERDEMEFTDETSACPEFERRMPGAGYRG